MYLMKAGLWIIRMIFFCQNDVQEQLSFGQAFVDLFSRKAFAAVEH